MKSKEALRNEEESSNPYFPFDQYGNYVAEMGQATSTPMAKIKAEKALSVDENAGVIQSSPGAQTLGIA